MKTPQDRFDSAAGIVAALAALGRVDVKPLRRWWRIHQAVVIGLYLPGVRDRLAEQRMVRRQRRRRSFHRDRHGSHCSRVFRGHLLFTERMNQPGLAAELRRTSRVTIVLDLLMAAALGADSAMLIAGDMKVAAQLTVGLGIVVALVRLVVEPSTTKAAFPDLVS